jgi:hypothetical protein
MQIAASTSLSGLTAPSATGVSAHPEDQGAWFITAFDKTGVYARNEHALQSALLQVAWLDRNRCYALIALKVPRKVIGNAVSRRGEQRGNGADARLAQETHQQVQLLSFLASRVGASRSASIPVALVPRDVIVGQ